MRNQLKTWSFIALLLSMGSLFLASCSTDNSSAADNNSNAVQVNQAEARPYDISENEKANMKLVNEYIEALLNANGDKAKSLVNEDYMGYGPASNDSLNVDQQIADWENNKKNRTDQKAGIIYMTSLRVNEGNLKGDWVQVWGNFTAIDNETQQSVAAPWHSVYLIENNKISASRSYWDNLAVGLQLGQVAPVND